VLIFTRSRSEAESCLGAKLVRRACHGQSLKLSVCGLGTIQVMSYSASAGHRCWHMMYSVTPHTTLPQDDEESRLLAVYATHRAKEHAAAHQVLHPTHSLPLRAYLELVGDLRILRTESNEKWRAIGAHRKKMAFERSDGLC
jgi:hypothetical protein